MRRRSLLLPGLLLLFTARLSPAVGAEAVPLALEADPIEERAWGVSLRPPLESDVSFPVGETDILRIHSPRDRVRLRVRIERSQSNLPLEAMGQKLAEQVTDLHETAVELGSELLQIDDHPARLYYFQIPVNDETSHELLGRSVTQIALNTYAVIDVAADIHDADLARATFEAVLNTARFADPAVLEDERREQTARARHLLAGITPKDLQAALIAEQWFRVVTRDANGSTADVGYVRMRQAIDEQSGSPGVSVEVKAHTEKKSGINEDRLEKYFLSDDYQFEAWTIVSTRRERGGPPSTVTETGFRTGGRIRVRLESTTGTTQFDLLRPDFAYLSYVESLLLPQLLPADRPAIYGFYHYHPINRRITYRTDEVVPAFNGFVLATRPSPNEPLFRSHFRGDGSCLRRGLSSDISLLPASPQALRRIWAARGTDVK